MTAQQPRIGTHEPAIYTLGSTTYVRYHWTDVVAFNAESITLNTGGYNTATTKTRMNQASSQFGLGYQVYQKGWHWYVDFKGETEQFKTNSLELAR